MTQKVKDKNQKCHVAQNDKKIVPETKNDKMCEKKQLSFGDRKRLKNRLIHEVINFINKIGEKTVFFYSQKQNIRFVQAT